MNQAEITQIMITLIRCFLTGKQPDIQLTPEQMQAVFALADKHDVAHLIAVVLERSGALGKDELFVQAKRKAIYRYIQQDHERQRIYILFENERLPFIPLKGSVINALYPEPWQRTGCDIDILVRKEDLDRAVGLLQQELGYTRNKTSAHDISLMAPGRVYLELHYDFDEKEVSVEDVWKCAAPVNDGSVQLAVSGAMFLLHHIAHMAKHFVIGGCGFRPFVDLWFIRQKMNCSETELNEKLEECGLKRFADVVFELLDVWFADGVSTPLLEATAEYILPAGVYGSVKNRVAIGQLNKGSKVSYFMSRLFQTREALEYPYPVLKRHGWMLPFCQVHRWYKLLADGKLKRITTELSANSTMDSMYRDDVGALLKELKLQ